MNTNPICLMFYVVYRRDPYLVRSCLLCTLMIFVKFPNFFILFFFADDTNIFRNGSDLDGLCTEISIELDKLNIWFAVNKLSLNVSKTNYIVFGKKSNSRSVLTINGYEIERVNVTKFLGVMIDEKLDWKIQIATVKNKLTKCLAVLYKARISLNYDAMSMLYNSIFLPYLSYCAEVWANTYKSKLNTLYITQKKAVRLIHNVSKYHHTSDLFKKNEKFKVL